MDSEELSHLKEILHSYRRRLWVLEGKEALQGLHTPPEVLLEMEDLREKMVRCQSQIENYLHELQMSQTASPSDTARKQIEITFNGSFDHLTPEIQGVLVRTVAAMADISPDQVVVLGMRIGSVIIIVEVPHRAATTLLQLFTSKDEVIEELGIENIQPATVEVENENDRTVAVAADVDVNILKEQIVSLTGQLAAYAEFEITYDQTLASLMSALDARDGEMEGHSTRVSRLSRLLGQEIGLSRHQLKALERGALLHDIGKIGISDMILHKPGKLTDDEWKIMRIHPEIGARIVERIPLLQDALPVIRYHHERWDGSGYPLGLKNDEIPIQARIFAVADVFDALTGKRSYRRYSTAEEAIQYIKEQSGILFDPRIVEALTRIPYKEFAEGEKIIL